MFKIERTYSLQLTDKKAVAWCAEHEAYIDFSKGAVTVTWRTASRIDTPEFGRRCAASALVVTGQPMSCTGRTLVEAVIVAAGVETIAALVGLFEKDNPVE